MLYFFLQDHLGLLPSSRAAVNPSM
jgi:hypothetical protein